MKNQACEFYKHPDLGFEVCKTHGTSRFCCEMTPTKPLSELGYLRHRYKRLRSGQEVITLHISDGKTGESVNVYADFDRKVKEKYG